MFLDRKFNINKHLQYIISNINYLIGLLRVLQIFISRNSRVTTYKSFLRLYLNYEDVIYDQVFNK